MLDEVHYGRKSLKALDLKGNVHSASLFRHEKNKNKYSGGKYWCWVRSAGDFDMFGPDVIMIILRSF